VKGGAGMGTDVADGCAGSSAMDEEERILDAAIEGDVDEVERLAEENPGLLEATDGAGTTPLMFASHVGSMGVVRYLLEKGAAVNTRDDRGSTALWYACCKESKCYFPGCRLLVQLLLDKGADPAITGDQGSTPLMGAVEQEGREVVKLLLGRPSGKATINYRNQRGETALWKACRSGRPEILRALLESGADPTIPDDNGTTPVAEAKRVMQSRYYAGRHTQCVAALEVSF
jgi:uncharacterized protein